MLYDSVVYGEYSTIRCLWCDILVLNMGSMILYNDCGVIY